MNNEKKLIIAIIILFLSSVYFLTWSISTIQKQKREIDFCERYIIAQHKVIMKSVDIFKETGYTDDEFIYLLEEVCDVK